MADLILNLTEPIFQNITIQGTYELERGNWPISISVGENLTVSMGENIPEVVGNQEIQVYLYNWRNTTWAGQDSSNDPLDSNFIRLNVIESGNRILSRPITTNFQTEGTGNFTIIVLANGIAWTQDPQMRVSAT